MTATADDAGSEAGPSQAARALAGKLGIRPGQTIQQLGWDDDCDAALTEAVTAVAGSAPVAADHQDVVDVVLLWYRDDDEDLVDTLVDAIGPLADLGVVWLLTPKMGRPGHVESSDIADAAPTAGLSATSTVSASRDWQGTRLVAPRARR